MQKRVSSFGVAGFVCFSLCIGLVAACGDDDDDDGVMPIAGTGVMPGGSGGSIMGGGGTSGTGNVNTGGSSGAGTGGTAGSSGSGGSGGSMAADCTTNGCPGGQFCVDKRCREMCTADAQCDSGDKCCDGGCIDVSSDHDNCGSCGTACDATERCVDGGCVALMCALDFDAGVSLDDNGCPANELCVDSGGNGVCMCGDQPSCPLHESCNDAGECRCGTNPGCADGEGCCGNDCVDLKTDEDNCGECGNKCATGATCTDGTCQCDTAGYGACHGTCIDLRTDESNCGECDNVCESPTTCRDPSGSRPLGCYCPNVNEVPCNGVCVALGTTDNCGSCGDSCDAPATVCRNQQCECPTVGQTACGNACVDLETGRDIDPSASNTLITDCGECGVTCLANAACTNGLCDCPGSPSTDMYCDENATTGATDGVYACIVVNTTKNCGECGNACLDDSVCRARTPTNSPDDYSCLCVNTDAGKTHCPGIGCRNLDDDPDNCGACGHQCPAGVDCNNGECDCPGGSSVDACLVDGEPACVDLSTDEANCGSCGHQCPADITCTSNRCQCPGGSNADACLVGGQPQCVNLANDENNCGECGNVCPVGSECCNRTCVDTDTYDTDEANCGSCGTQCPTIGCGFLGLQACNCNNGNCG